MVVDVGTILFQLKSTVIASIENIKIENLRKSVPSALFELQFGCKNTYLVVISRSGGIFIAFITN